VAIGWTGRDLRPASGTNLPDSRRAPRIDVLTRVEGRLVALNTPVIIHDLSRTGFAVVSQCEFEPGQLLDFQLVADEGPSIKVTAEAVHSRPMHTGAGLYLSGFKFVPGKLTGMVPQALIDRLIEAVSPSGPCF
jgi:hypothetical protein